MDVSAGPQRGRSRSGRSRASDSPSPGEHRKCERPGQTKNTEQFDDGLELERVGAVVHRGALRTAVREELFGERFGEECHCDMLMVLHNCVW